MPVFVIVKMGASVVEVAVGAMVADAVLVAAMGAAEMKLAVVVLVADAVLTLSCGGGAGRCSVATSDTPTPGDARTAVTGVAEISASRTSSMPVIEDTAAKIAEFVGACAAMSTCPGFGTTLATRTTLPEESSMTTCFFGTPKAAAKLLRTLVFICRCIPSVNVAKSKPWIVVVNSTADGDAIGLSSTTMADGIALGLAIGVVSSTPEGAAIGLSTTGAMVRNTLGLSSSGLGVSSWGTK